MRKFLLTLADKCGNNDKKIPLNNNVQSELSTADMISTWREKSNQKHSKDIVIKFTVSSNDNQESPSTFIGYQSPFYCKVQLIWNYDFV